MAKAEIRHNLGEILSIIESQGRNIPKALENAARDIRNELEQRYRPTYAYWEHRPTVNVDVHAHPRRMDIVVETDRIYSFVDLGTRPHPIFARRAPVLHFLSDYQPKTMPGVLGSGSGGAYGDDVFARRVMHPGTQARGFTKRIFRDAREWSARMIYGHLLKALNRR